MKKKGKAREARGARQEKEKWGKIKKNPAEKKEILPNFPLLLFLPHDREKEKNWKNRMKL